MSSIRQGISELPHICKAYGIDYAVISPGSRNAPLTIAFALHPDFRCKSIIDERSAGYFALGVAQTTRKPVILICTSGTAAINYGPALAEAYYLRIPLIAITADRPPEWIDQNDGQTIRQNGLFENFVKGSFELPVDTSGDNDLWLFRRKFSEALALATTGLKGPVHINIPLREPLYNPLPNAEAAPNVITRLPDIPKPSEAFKKNIIDRWSGHKKRWIVCGIDQYNEHTAKHIQRIIDNQQAVVIAENLANVKAQNIIENPDTFIASLNEQEKEDLRPELLITTGGAILSKKLKNFLREYKPKEHWHVGLDEPFTDTFKSLNNIIDISADSFWKILPDKDNNTDNDYGYCNRAKAIQKQLNRSHEEFLHNIPFSDMAAYQVIFSALPENITLHLANSTPVRYSQVFPSQKKVRYLSNRGTSGIDGCLSTAIGAATVSENLHVAILGDLAFIYDSNALWNNKLPQNIKIIVIDNQGGNIFRLIETSPVIAPIMDFFETPHHTNMEGICKAFDVDYHKATNKKELEAKMITFFKPNYRPAVLHITTCGQTSEEVFKNYYQHIKHKR